jgi:hypothetical protein
LSSFQVELTSDFYNLYNLKKKNYVHSKVNPNQESKRFLDSISLDFTNIKSIFVIGIGFAYHIDELFHRIEPFTKVYCMEPEQKVLELEQVKKKSQT